MLFPYAIVDFYLLYYGAVNMQMWALLTIQYSIWYSGDCKGLWTSCFVFVFACVFTQEFFTHMETSNYRWRGGNFYLYSALMTIEQWGFLSVAHLLWHGISVYNAIRLAVELLQPVIELSLLRFEHPIFRMQRERPNRLRQRRGWHILGFHCC